MIFMDGREAYQHFLLSDFWIRVSNNRRSKAKFRCERCGAFGDTQAHHKFYRPQWFDVQPEDLEVLCSSCHSREHREFKTLGKLQSARSRLEISRETFIRERQKFSPKKRRRMIHQSLKKIMKQKFSYNRPHRPRWVNRGNSSN